MKMPLLIVAVVMVAGTARAQEFTEDYIANQLAAAARQIQAEGLDGSAETTPRVIEILQAYGIPGAFQTSPDEARMLVRSEREDSTRLKQASLDLSDTTSFRFATPATRLLAGFVLVGQAMTCAVRNQKADAADRLSNVLWGLSTTYVIAGGIAAGTGAGAILAAPLGVGALVTAVGATWAGKLAAKYRATTCSSERGNGWQQPRSLQAYLAPEPFRSRRPGRGAPGSLRMA